MKLLLPANLLLGLLLSIVLLDPKHSSCHARALKKKKGKASAERAVTMWWVLFNKPSECVTSPENDVKCGMPDVMGNAENGTNTPGISIIHATGGIADKKGFLRLTATLYTTTCNLDLVDETTGNGHYTYGGPPPLYALTGSSVGYCPNYEESGEEPEVHIVFRDHGPVTDDKLWQITRFTDPSCSDLGGPNVCADIGAIAFASFNEDKMVETDVGHSPMFPPGCAKAGECDKAVEEIQLTSGEGNSVTVIRTGDTLQAVAEIKLPKVKPTKKA